MRFSTCSWQSPLAAWGLLKLGGLGSQRERGACFTRASAVCPAGISLSAICGSVLVMLHNGGDVSAILQVRGCRGQGRRPALARACDAVEGSRALESLRKH